MQPNYPNTPEQLVSSPKSGVPVWGWILISGIGGSFIGVLLTVILLPALAQPLKPVVAQALQNDRAIFSVNGEPVSKRDLDNYLETRYGPQVKAELVQAMLIEQQAKKLNLIPSAAEVDEEYNTQRDGNWQFAREIQAKPWMSEEMHKNIRLNIEKNRLLTYSIKVTVEQRKEEYNRHPSAYDTPNKARVEFGLVLDASHTHDVILLLRKPVNPTVIMQDLKGSVAFLGYENKLTIVQPFGDDNTNSAIFSMKPNEVKKLPPGEFARYGAKDLVIRLIDKTAGQKANLNDPKVIERLTMAVAAQRSKPWQEYLSKLWADAQLEFEDPNDKRYIEYLLFPDRAGSR